MEEQAVKEDAGFAISKTSLDTSENHNAPVLDSTTQLIDWANDHREFIISLIQSGNFCELLNQCCAAEGDSSIRKWATRLGCSRRSVRRYRNGERKIPFGVLKVLMSVLGIENSELLAVMKDEYETYCSDLIPATTDGRIIWYGELDDLVNTLYVYRTIIKSMSFFQMAYSLEIDPEILADYESGKKKIPPFDITKICRNLVISLTDLFPQLISWDGGKSYLPLAVEGSIRLKDNENWWIEYYERPNGDAVTLIQDWPINRYNPDGKILMNVMPDEISMDEYYNTSELLFYDEENDMYYPGPKYSLDELPPNYYRFQQVFLDQRLRIQEKKNRKCFKIKIIDIKYEEANVICYVASSQSSFRLDVSPYVLSASPLYKMLADPDYFRSGVLTYADPRDECTQCVMWPDGQYIRVDELTLDRTPYTTCFPIFRGVSVRGKIENWMLWE